MTNTTNDNPDHPADGRKRARLFGRDPLPGFVFSLDTSSNNRIHISSEEVSSSPSPSPSLSSTRAPLPRDSTLSTPTTDGGGARRRRAPSSAGAASTPARLLYYRDSSRLSSTLNSDDNTSSDDPKPSQTATPPATATAASSPESVKVERDSAAAASSVSASVRHTTAAGGKEVPAMPLATVSAAVSLQQGQDQMAPVMTPSPSAMLSLPVTEGDTGKEYATVDGNRRGEDVRDTADEPGKSTQAAGASITTPRTGPTGGSSSGSGGDVSTGAAAASLVASFLKRGSTAPLPAAAAAAAAVAAAAVDGGASKPSTTNRPRTPGASISNEVYTSSPHTTPTPLASLVTGVALGSGGSTAAGSSSVGSGCSNSGDKRRAGFCSPNGASTRAPGAENRIQSPQRGGNRLFHSEWPPSLKRRRRILHFPKPSDPVRDVGGGRWRVAPDGGKEGEREGVLRTSAWYFCRRVVYARQPRAEWWPWSHAPGTC